MTKLFAIIGLRGSGKTTLIDRVCEQDEGLVKYIRHTTREMRLGEYDGEDHIFVTESYFKKNKNQFLFTYRYKDHFTVGFENKFIEEQQEQNKDILLTFVDPKDYLAFKEIRPDIIPIYVFCNPFTAFDRTTQRSKPAYKDLNECNMLYFDLEKHNYNHIIFNDSNKIHESTQLMLDYIQGYRK